MAPSTLEIVNPVPVEEVAAWLRAMATTFLRDPHGPSAESQVAALTREWEAHRAWGARERGRWVATLRSTSRPLTVPGAVDGTREVVADALTNVTVSATHRRRGLLTQMLTESLRGARERGEPVSILIAAEWPIYGRYGYAPAILGANYTFHRHRAGATLTGEVGRVRQVEREEFGAVAPAVFDAFRRRRAGQIDRDERWWNRMLGLDGYAAPDGIAHNWLLHDGDDGPDGLLAWKAGGDFGLIPPMGKVAAWSLVAGSDEAYRNLWAYLAGLDVVDEITLSARPVDEEVRWLLHDARTLVQTEHVDFTWLRILDVPAALSARRYAVPGEVVLEVLDEDGEGFAAGRYLLAAGAEGAECAPTTRDPDLRIAQRALASIYLGGFRLRERLIAGGVEEVRPGALALVDLMFSTPLAPWNATWF